MSSSSVDDLLKSLENLKNSIENTTPPNQAQLIEWKEKILNLYDKLVLMEWESTSSDPSLSQKSTEQEAVITSEPLDASDPEPLSPEPPGNEPFPSSLTAVSEETKTSDLFTKLASKHQTESLNEQFETVASNLADELKSSPIKDLKAAIGVNQRVTFIFELFENDSANFDSALSKLDAFGDLKEAEQYITTELRSKYQWDEKESLATEFRELVKRRYS